MTQKTIELKKVSFRDKIVLKYFVRTVTADDNYSLLNRDNLTEPIEILSSEKQKSCSEFLSLHF